MTRLWTIGFPIGLTLWLLFAGSETTAGSLYRCATDTEGIIYTDNPAPHHRQRRRDQSRHRLIRWPTSRNTSRSTSDGPDTAGTDGRDVATRICAPDDRRASAKRCTQCSALSNWNEPLEPIQLAPLPSYRNRSSRNDHDTIKTRRTAGLPHTALAETVKRQT
jgi:hypothetical protein